MFKDRRDAGRRLAQRIEGIKEADLFILAVPRGGVVVAFEVVKALGAPMDLIIPRKLGAPGNPELAIGAVTQDGTIVLNHDIVQELGVPKSFIDQEAAEQVKEIERRMKKYRGDAPPPQLAGRTVVLIDDGIATGATIRAAVQSVRRSRPKRLIIAVPVAPPSAVQSLEKDADEVVALETPEWFMAIGQFYENFDQTSDEEVIDLMAKAKK